MNKRYQVFVSSTFLDLKEERKAVIESLLNAGFIPAGMEMFSAANDDQFQYIKKIIDNCDYYILIIAGRYGSTSSPQRISYTELEYDYAVSKGLPILAFLYDKPYDLPGNKRDDSHRRKLEKFRNKVSKNRLYKSWHSIGDLVSSVVISLSEATLTHPQSGWVRGSEIQALEQQEKDLRSNNANLLQRISQLETQNLTLNESNKSLYGVHLNRLNLSGACLKGARLTMASLKATHLDGSDLTGANLDHANFSYSSLRGAILRGVSCTNTLFVEADLCGADLRTADLSNANFIDANLERADLRGARLHTRVFMRVNLTGAIIDSDQIDDKLVRKSLHVDEMMVYVKGKDVIVPYGEYAKKY